MQNNLMPMTRPDSDPTVNLAYATVTGRADKWFFLNAGGTAPGRALRADSCLIAPAPGDMVLVSNGGAAGVNAVSYILAVLVRAAPEQASLEFPGGVGLHIDHGNLRVSAQQVALDARASVSLQAPAIEMAALRGDLTFDTLNASAREVAGRFGAVRTVAHSITSTVGRLVQKARDSFRWTENVDETRTGRMRLQVEERFHLKAKHATVLAEGQVKIDGEKIDLG